MTLETAGSNSTDDHLGTDDVSVWDSSNHGGDAAQFIGSANFYCSLYRFTGVTGIPSSASVSDAEFFLYVEGSFGSNDKDIDLRLCLRSFIEGEATTSIYSTGNSWTTANGRSDGNDRSGTISGTIPVIDGVDPAYFSVSSAQLAADFEDFIDGTLINNGHHADCDDTNAMQITGSEGTDGQRPYVLIDFTVGGGTIYDYTNTEGALASDTNADLMVLGESKTETALASDLNLDQAIFNESLTENALATDTNIDILILLESITEGLIAGDTTNEIAVLIESLTETAVLSDFESNQVIFAETITEGILASDLISGLMVFGEVKTEGAIAGDFDSDVPLISGPIKITVTAKQPGITIESKQGTITLTVKKPKISTEEWE